MQCGMNEIGVYGQGTLEAFLLLPFLVGSSQEGSNESKDDDDDIQGQLQR